MPKQAARPPPATADPTHPADLGQRPGAFESFFHSGSLAFPETELKEVLRMVDTVPALVCVNLERPAVLPGIATHAAALMAAFGASDTAVLDVAFGRARAEGRLPFGLPRSMAAVAASRPDVPDDTEDPVFRRGHGLALCGNSLGRPELSCEDGRMPTSYDIPEVLDRREGPHGEIVLRRHGELLQIIANGCFLMDTSDGRSERLLVGSALAALDGRPGPRLLIGGLGVGFSLAHAAADPRPGRITVVERESAIIGWHLDGPLADFSARAVADARTEILETDLVAYVHETSDRYDALCLDIDNGPGWTVTEGNESLYSLSGLTACARVLRPGGVLAVWSAQPSAEFEETLRNAGFQQVRTEEIPVARGVPDVVHLAVRPG